MCREFPRFHLICVILHPCSNYPSPRSRKLETCGNPPIILKLAHYVCSGHHSQGTVCLLSLLTNLQPSLSRLLIKGDMEGLSRKSVPSTVHCDRMRSNTDQLYVTGKKQWCNILWMWAGTHQSCRGGLVDPSWPEY